MFQQFYESQEKDLPTPVPRHAGSRKCGWAVRNNNLSPGFRAGTGPDEPMLCNGVVLRQQLYREK